MIIGPVFMGCHSTEEFLPEVLLSSMEALDGPIRLTWYLSDELKNLANLKTVDTIMANLASRDSSVSAVVRSPGNGERQPDFLLPLPGRDSTGEMVFLWSALVIDWKNERIVIPDIWDPEWLILDLSRAFQDLHDGGAVSVGYCDGSSNAVGLPVSLLEGRWKMNEWIHTASPTSFFDILLIQDGPVLGEMKKLTKKLEGFLDSGGRILFTGSLRQPLSPAGEWASERESDASLIFIDDTDFLNPAVYQNGIRSFRDIDTALLLTAGRSDLIAVMSSGIKSSKPRGWKAAGTRLLKETLRQNDVFFPDSSRVDCISFSDARNYFSLKRNGAKWTLASQDWELPARGDRIESFLERLSNGSGSIWRVSGTSDLSSKLEIEFFSKHTRMQILKPIGRRLAGGGVYMETGNDLILWPGITAADVSGDARYWMERRLFPERTKVIRVELSNNERLFWRLHEEAGIWLLTDRNGKRRIMEGTEAHSFIERLLLSESVTIAPSRAIKESFLVLRIENDSGRFTEYRLADMDNGRVAALSSGDGNLHILDHILVQFILAGPRES